MELKLNAQVIKDILINYYRDIEHFIPEIKITSGLVRTRESYLPPRIALTIEVIKYEENEMKANKTFLSKEKLLEILTIVLNKSQFVPSDLEFEIDKETNQLIFKVIGQKIQENQKSL